MEMVGVCSGDLEEDEGRANVYETLDRTLAVPDACIRRYDGTTRFGQAF